MYLFFLLYFFSAGFVKCNESKDGKPVTRCGNIDACEFGTIDAPYFRVVPFSSASRMALASVLILADLVVN